MDLLGTQLENLGTQELFPKLGIHPQGASLALQVCLGLR